VLARVKHRTSTVCAAPRQRLTKAAIHRLVNQARGVFGLLNRPPEDPLRLRQRYPTDRCLVVGESERTVKHEAMLDHDTQ
jgi:hypothetical protein